MINLIEKKATISFKFDETFQLTGINLSQINASFSRLPMNSIRTLVAGFADNHNRMNIKIQNCFSE